MGQGQVFRFRHTVGVRFRDLDPMGHAHHTLPLIYFEEARAAYWRDVVGREGIEGIDYLLAEARVDFHGRIRFPSTLSVGVRVSRLGTKSLTMEYEAAEPSGRVLASGSTVQVMYDYAAERSKPIGETVRRRIQDYEAGLVS